MEGRGSPRWTSRAAAVLGSALLAACGGGSVTVSGAAVTGVALSDAAIGGGAVTLTDSSAAAQQRQVSTRSDGSFSVDVSGLTPPYTLRVAWNAAGTPQRLYAIAEGGEAIDITPITDLAVAYATADAGEEALLTATPTQKRLATVQARAVLTDLTAELAPLLNRYAIADLRTDTDAVRQLLQEVSVSQSAGTVTFSNRRTGQPISTISLADPQRGRFDPSQIPTGMPPGCLDPSHTPSGGPPGGFDPGQLPTGAPFGPPPGASSGGPWSSSSSGGTSSGGSDATVGAPLYAQRCARCHGALGSSEYQGATASEILSKHGNLVTSDEAAALASALSGSAGSSGGASSGSASGGPPQPPGSSSGGASSGGSSGPPRDLPPGHPAVSSGATCSSCHGGGLNRGTPPGSSGGTSSSGGFPGSSGGFPPPAPGSPGGTSSSGGSPGSASGGTTSSSGGASGNLPGNHPAVPSGSSCSDCH